MRKFLGLATLVTAVALCAAPANAAFVVSVTGSGSYVAPPSDASPGAFEANSYSVWDETSGTIVSDLAVDHDGTPGTNYKGSDDFSGLSTTLTAGTKYNSSIVHLDPVGTTTTGLGLQAVITFAKKIIGISLFSPSIDNGDIYGAVGTTYPTNGIPVLPGQLDTRGIDFRANDRFDISLDGKTLTVKFTANNAAFDQIRVFTSGVPEPASLAVWTLLGSAVGGGTWWRRRKPAA